MSEKRSISKIDAQRHPLPPGARHLELQDPIQGAPVGQPGQGIGVGESIEPLRALGAQRQGQRPLHRHGRQVGDRLGVHQSRLTGQRPGEPQRHDAQRDLDALPAHDQRHEQGRGRATENGDVGRVVDFERAARTGHVGEWIVALRDGLDGGGLRRRGLVHPKRDGYLELVAIWIDDVGRRVPGAKVFGSQPQQFGQCVVQVVAAGHSGGSRRE
jgi:hypothetical protein